MSMEAKNMIGRICTLPIMRLSQYGAFLQANQQEILLPKKFVDSTMRIGTKVVVFVMTDSQDRIVATTQSPKLLLHQFGALEVVDIHTQGYFVDLGVDKHLFVSSKRPQDSLLGQKIVVFLTLDKQGRLIGKLGIKERLQKCRGKTLLGSVVEALVFERTDLGFSCVVCERKSLKKTYYYGLMYYNEVFFTLNVGDKIKARVKHIRLDGKLDLTPDEQKDSLIIEALKAHNGILELDFKSESSEIAKLLGISKKRFKTLTNKLVREQKVCFIDSTQKEGRKTLVLV